MGKGTIHSHIGSGRYMVTIKRDRTRITQRLSVIASRLAALPGIILGHETARDSAEVEYNTAVGTLNSIIAEMKLHPTELKTYQAQIEAQTKIVLEKEKVWRSWIAAVNGANLEYTSLTLEQGKLNGTNLSDPTVAAYCADLTTTLTGDVATAEVPGERGGLVILPGYTGDSDYTASRDGQLQPVLASTPAGAAYNFAMLPGWQKWKPTYRFGVIMSKSGNTCSVQLEDTKSSAQGITIDPTRILTNVPISYMDCDGQAFSVGDSVIVQFEGQSRGDPKVIGFKASPKACPEPEEGWIYPANSWIVTGYFPHWTEMYGWLLPKDCLNASYYKPWGSGSNSDPLDLTGALAYAYVWLDDDSQGHHNMEQPCGLDMTVFQEMMFPDWPNYTYWDGWESEFTPFYGTSEDWFGYQLTRATTDTPNSEWPDPWTMPDDWWRGIPEEDPYGFWSVYGRPWAAYIREDCGAVEPGNVDWSHWGTTWPIHEHFIHGKIAEKIDDADWPESWKDYVLNWSGGGWVPEWVRAKALICYHTYAAPVTVPNCWMIPPYQCTWLMTSATEQFFPVYVGG